MNQPWIYMCCPTRFPLPPPSPSHPSGSSQCTSPEHPSHAEDTSFITSHLIILRCDSSPHLSSYYFVPHLSVRADGPTGALSPVQEAVVNGAVCWVPFSPQLQEVPVLCSPCGWPCSPRPPWEGYPSPPTHLSKQWAADRIQYSSMMDPPQMWKPV